MTSNPISTPIKTTKTTQEGGKIRWQTMNMIEQIKRIVSGDGVSDRAKVGQLKRLLGLMEEEGLESEAELKDLLSDYKKTEEVIQID